MTADSQPAATPPHTYQHIAAEGQFLRYFTLSTFHFELIAVFFHAVSESFHHAAFYFFLCFLSLPFRSVFDITHAFILAVIVFFSPSLITLIDTDYHFLRRHCRRLHASPARILPT